ncbi:uncharacterized protein G2W53_010175 [Senna tora]|uniref:Uncharacterized protein n=1 Tax=Senna tora TaxID=362788 RepID=A0A835C919_9FABA|nr:uncharacterized protein G2W53_010175 [Senna tora]
MNVYESTPHGCVGGGRLSFCKKKQSHKGRINGLGISKGSMDKRDVMLGVFYEVVSLNGIEGY